MPRTLMSDAHGCQMPGRPMSRTIGEEEGQGIRSAHIPKKADIEGPLDVAGSRSAHGHNGSGGGEGLARDSIF